MKPLFQVLFNLTIYLILQTSYGQTDCNNPLDVYTCPAATLTGQTNVGMGDDVPNLENIPGEDVVYHIHTALATTRIYILISNIQSAGSITGRVTLVKQNCTGTPVFSLPITTGMVNLGLGAIQQVGNASDYFLFVDFANATTYDIAFGADTGLVNVSWPNTQGQLLFDSCAANPFNANKAFFEVQYNSVYQYDPMTLSPLLIPGQLCIDVFLQNTTGVSGPKNFIFQFQKAGLTNVSPVLNAVPGFESSGNWNYNSSTSSTFTNMSYKGIAFQYWNSTCNLCGDITGNPNSCMRYSFCFNVTPISNQPQLTNIKVIIYSDLNGFGFTGVQLLSCCASGMSSLCGGLGGGAWSGGAQSIGFGFDDPGNALPITLLDFHATNRERDVQLNWSTASEINNDFFTVERSADGDNWKELGQIPGAGNSTSVNEYRLSDNQPLNGISYYRLKQTDYDGQYAYFDPIALHRNDRKVTIYPVPAREILNIESPEDAIREILLYDIRTTRIPVPYSVSGTTCQIRTDQIPTGFYYLEILTESGERIYEKVQVQH